MNKYRSGNWPEKADVDVLRTALMGSPVDDTFLQRALGAIEGLPTDTHPMTQFITGVLGAESSSEFADQYRKGTVNKETLWQPVLADGLHLVSDMYQLFNFTKKIRPTHLHLYMHPHFYIDMHGCIYVVFDVYMYVCIYVADYVCVYGCMYVCFNYACFCVRTCASYVCIQPC